MKIEEKDILKFHDDYKPSNFPPSKEGFYMTIRCGLGGIYTCLNEWKDDRWQVEVADASHTIAYSKEQIPKEEVTKWAREKLREAGF
jgi:hypothetical protein